MSDSIPQRINPFYGDQLIAVQQSDGAIVVVFAWLCENLGVARNMQSQRIRTQEVLREGLVSITIQTEATNRSHSVYASIYSHSGFLVFSPRTKPKVRDKLIR